MSVKDPVLYHAKFNPRLRQYVHWGAILTFMMTVVGIPLIPLWLLIAPYFVRKHFDSLECALSARSVHFKKGYLFMMERTIPLDKIQDLTFKEGPLLKHFGLSVLRVETAGSSGNAQGDLSLTGIVDASAFRRMVLDQRDLVTDNRRSGSGEEDENATSILSDIRDSLRRIEAHLERSPGTEVEDIPLS